MKQRVKNIVQQREDTTLLFKKDCRLHLWKLQHCVQSFKPMDIMFPGLWSPALKSSWDDE
eukprot:494447-Prorocentrum_lima.AAC.1